MLKKMWNNTNYGSMRMAVVMSVLSQERVMLVIAGSDWINGNSGTISRDHSDHIICGAFIKQLLAAQNALDFFVVPHSGFREGIIGEDPAGIERSAFTFKEPSSNSILNILFILILIDNSDLSITKDRLAQLKIILFSFKRLSEAEIECFKRVSDKSPFSCGNHEFVNIVVNHRDLGTDTESQFERVGAILTSWIIEVFLQVIGLFALLPVEVDGHDVHIGHKFKSSSFTCIKIESLICKNFNNISNTLSDFISAVVLFITNLFCLRELGITCYICYGDVFGCQVWASAYVNIEDESLLNIFNGILKIWIIGVGGFQFLYNLLFDVCDWGIFPLLTILFGQFFKDWYN